MHKLYDGHGDLDLTTNDILTFITGSKMVLINYVSYCMDNNLDDFDNMVYWSQVLNAVLKVKDMDALIDITNELDFKISIR